ncbi:MAG: hypothetical protein QOF33_1131, partial [Thermomicrobiales bacterium]|nr:hypothetical protein [Thermomicrobiales bacterium]
MPESAQSPAGRTSAFSRRIFRLVQAAPIAVLAIALTLGASQIWTARAERAAAYATAARALANGDFIAARDGFADLGDYRDADSRFSEASAALAPYESAFDEARIATASGRFGDAIAALTPIVRELPSFQPAAILLDEARHQRREALLTE